MNGVPLVYYTLAAIREYLAAHGEDRVTIALNTDSPELTTFVQSQTLVPDIRYTERKTALAGDQAPKVAVIQDTFLTLSEEMEFDVVVDLDITSPLRRRCDLEHILETYCKMPDCDLVFSVVPARRNPYFNMVEKKPNGYYKKICDANFTARQQAPRIYEMNASIYAYRPSFLASTIDKSIIDYRCGIVEMPDYLVLDIDSEEDFKMMQYLHRYYCGLDAELRQVFETAKKARA